MAKRHVDRIYSGKRQLRSDTIHTEAVRRLQTWLDHPCPDPNQESTVMAYFKVLKLPGGKYF